MDLLPYLRRVRRYLVAFILLSVLVGLATAYLEERRTDETFRATLDLRLPVFTNQVRELDQVMADFIDGINDPRVLAVVSESSGLRAETLAQTLTAERLSASGSQVRVAANGADPDRLSEAVAAAARESFAALAAPRIEAAQSLESQLRSVYEQVKGTTGGQTPEEQRQQSQAEFAALRVLTDAQAARFEAENRVTSVKATASAGAVQVAPVDARWRIAQVGVTNAGAALFSLLALLVTIELWRTRPSRFGADSSTSRASPVGRHGEFDQEEETPAVLRRGTEDGGRTEATAGQSTAPDGAQTIASTRAYR